MANLHRAERLDMVARRVETKAFALARSSEEAALAAGRRWVTAVGRLAPFEMPAAQRVVRGMLDAAEDALTAPRQIAEKMLHQVHDTLGMTPPTTTPGSPAPKPTPRPTPRPRKAAPSPRTAAPSPRTAAPGPRTAAPRPRTAAPGPRKAAPRPRTTATHARKPPAS